MEDAGEVLVLQRAAFLAEGERHGTFALPPLTEDLAGVRAALADPATTVLGVRDGHRLVGVVRLHPDPQEPGTWWLARLAVAPDRQGEGLAGALVAAIEAALPPEARAVRLLTGERNAPALGLTRAAAGWRPTARPSSRVRRGSTRWSTCARRWPRARPRVAGVSAPTAVEQPATPDPHLATHPAVLAARAEARRLAAAAPRLEAEGVRREDLDGLAAAGLLGLWAAPEAGGAPLPVRRRVAELLSGASPDAWFVWFQHNPVVGFLSGSENAPLAAVWLPRLTSGEARAGVAFSHLRSSRPGVTGERVAGGWRLTGSQPWCTGWGLTDVVLAGAHDPASDEVVFGLVAAHEQPGLASAGELRLAAMAGTRTHALRFDGLVLRDEDVVLRRDRAEWQAGDEAANSNVQPSTPGVALAALDLLAEREPETAQALRARLLDARARAYALQDDVPAGERVAERLAVRAELHELAVLATSALLAARGGFGMDLDQPAQRLHRAAAFQLVHSQAPHVREAQLARLAAVA